MSGGPVRVAEISLPAIRRNVLRIRELVAGGGGAAVIAVVKANGYGHGAVDAARAALEGGASMLGVADQAEALALRAAGIDAPVLCWLHGADADFERAVAERIEIAVSRPAQLEAVADAARRAGVAATVQFKVETGLSRGGAAPVDWRPLFARGVELEHEGLVRVRGIFSHLSGTSPEHDLAQAARFDEAVALLRAAGCEPELVHLAASAATFSLPQLHYTAVRVGISVYGLSPFDDRDSAALGLTPAMTLRSEVVAVRRVPAGAGVSYGFTHVADRETALALVPVGYADGLPRALSSTDLTVVIGGRRYPVVGRVSMDQIVVDVGDAPVSLGDPVVLFGDPASGAPAVEEWARRAGTINYEIVTGIGGRVTRTAVDR